MRFPPNAGQYLTLAIELIRDALDECKEDDQREYVKSVIRFGVEKLFEVCDTGQEKQQCSSGTDSRTHDQ